MCSIYESKLDKTVICIQYIGLNDFVFIKKHREDSESFAFRHRHSRIRMAGRSLKNIQLSLGDCLSKDHYNIRKSESLHVEAAKFRDHTRRHFLAIDPSDYSIHRNSCRVLESPEFNYRCAQLHITRTSARLRTPSAIWKLSLSAGVKLASRY